MRKIWYCTVVIVALVRPVLSQTTFTGPIGSDMIIYRFDGNNYPDEGNCYPTIFCHNYMYTLPNASPQVPFYSSFDSAFIHAGISLDTLDQIEIHVTPNSPLIIDTVRFSYIFDQHNDFHCPSCVHLLDQLQFTVKGYYDSKIKIIPVCEIVDAPLIENRYNKMPFDTMFMYYDSSKYKITSWIRTNYIANYGGVMIFNNKSDSITLSDWKMSYDSSKSLSLSVMQDSIAVQKIDLPPLSYQYNVSFQFRSTHPPLISDTTFPAAVQCTAHFAGKDSICIVPVNFYFFAGPKSDVAVTKKERTFSVFPNPAFGAVQISCKGYSESIIHLQITDELGREVTKVFDGKLIGDETFSVDLARGIYFVQLRTADGIAMRKILVE
jgi:hypothetical protein